MYNLSQYVGKPTPPYRTIIVTTHEKKHDGFFPSCFYLLNIFTSGYYTQRLQLLNKR